MAISRQLLAELAVAEVAAVIGVSAPAGLVGVVERWLVKAEHAGGRAERLRHDATLARVEVLEARIRDYQRELARLTGPQMDLVAIPKRTAEDADGPWWIPVTSDGKPTAVVCCPNGHRGLLDHEVAVDGTVRPSLVCPDDTCGWHVWGRLVGWKP